MLLSCQLYDRVCALKKTPIRIEMPNTRKKDRKRREKFSGEGAVDFMDESVAEDVLEAVEGSVLGAERSGVLQEEEDVGELETEAGKECGESLGVRWEVDVAPPLAMVEIADFVEPKRL
ncbi:hypothetical protein ACLOJK_001775 [Asimina triloba]